MLRSFVRLAVRTEKVQGQNRVGRPHAPAEHQTNGVFHLYFTPSLAAERVSGHESAVIMVSYCICTPILSPRMNVPTGETVVID